MRLIDADAFKKVLSELEMEYYKRRSFNEYSYGSASAYEYAGYLLDEQPTVEERPHDKWEYLKEHITEMRDADGELNQKQTCQFILNLMDVIEKGGEEE